MQIRRDYESLRYVSFCVGQCSVSLHCQLVIASFEKRQSFKFAVVAATRKRESNKTTVK